MGQIIEASNPLMDIKTYEPNENEVKYFRPRYNTETCDFLGVYETVGLLVGRGQPDEIFLNYDFDEEKAGLRRSSLTLGRKMSLSTHKSLILSMLKRR